MRRIILAPLLLLAPVSALAQQVPADAERDLWCGTAFELMVKDAPADETAEKLAAAKVYADGGALLVNRALPIYLESGYSDAALTELRENLAASIGRIIDGNARSGEDATYSFQDCSALIGQ